MSSIVSRRPSSRNHWNEAFWMSMRLGRSRTCSILEKDLRARGEATVVVKEEASLGDVRAQANSSVQAGGQTERRRNPSGYRKRPPHRKRGRLRAPVWSGKCSSEPGGAQARPGPTL